MKYLLVLLLMSMNIQFSLAQCFSTISSFPYNQGFESGAGGWASGGINNSWVLGSPSKSQITSAGSGMNCWVTGGLTGSAYNNNERSYVTSPCFDFSSVAYPFISMKIFWESEQNFDGATFQYSTNNGATWTNVGASLDPINCFNENWFNTSNVNYLTTLANPKDGWSGSVVTSGSCPSMNGSNGWVTAKHCMSYLAGLPSVQFRFAFGAGNICNNLDGFAFDDIFIGEALPNSANFFYACNGSPLSYQFNHSSLYCPIGFVWDFGDPASGANNVSSNPNPIHVFSSPGTYIVSLMVSGPCNASSSISKNVVTIGANSTIVQPLCANNGVGTISTIANNATGNVTYSLQPSGLSNSSGIFSNLAPNNYTVTISDAINCVITNTANIIAPSPLSWAPNFATQNVSCFGLSNGSISGTVNGGTGLKTYTLQPNNISNTSGSFINLAIANYTVTVSDANGCSISTLVPITQPQTITMNSNVLIQHVACSGGSSGSVSLSASGGLGSFQYAILPGGATNTTGVFQNLTAGNYTVLASDANSCSASTVVTINGANPIFITNVSLVNPWCNPNNNGSISIAANGGNGTLQFAINGNFSTNSNFQNLLAGNYTIVVKDANGCTQTSLARLFTPSSPIFTQTNIGAVSCYGGSNGKLDVAAISGVAIIGYEVSPGNINQISGNFANLSAGNYTVITTDAQGCSSTIQMTISSPQQLVIDQIYSTTLDSCGEQLKADIEVRMLGGTQPYLFRMLPLGNTSNTGKFLNLSIGNYVVQVTDANNCTTSSPLEIKEKLCCDRVVLPLAFTPNKDGRNDEFKPLYIEGIDIVDFSIFNRFGQIVFKAQHNSDAWDGKFKGVESEIGTYFYQMKYRCKATSKETYLKGEINVIR